MRVKTALLVAALTCGGLLAVWSEVAEAQGRGQAQPRPPQGGGQGPPPSAGRGGGQPGPGPGGGPGYPGGRGGGGGPVYGRPGPGYGRPGYPGGGYGYYRPSYFYSPWGWYPWYPGFYGFYGGYGWYGGWYGPYGPYGYYGGYYGSSLKVEVQPKDAEVFVDGHRAGIVDEFDGFWQRLEVESGAHDITLFKPGFRTVTQKLYLQPGSTFKLKYVMEPLAAGEVSAPPPQPQPDPQPYYAPDPQARRPLPPSDPRPMDEPPQPPPPRVEAESRYGELAIRVQPEGAQVFIDGEAWQGPRGMARLVVHLPVGMHRIEVRKDGFEPFSAQFEIKPGETTALNVSLVGLQ